MGDEETRQRVWQRQGEHRHALRTAEIRHIRERCIAKPEPPPFLIGNLLALPQRLDQCAR
jgi:hypothetical protein